jgi:hypothetical protein
MTRVAVGPASTAVGPTAAWTTSPAYQAYELLHVGFAVLPIVAGLDKFFHFLQIGSWEGYLAPIVTQAIPLEATTIMMMVGGIEVAAGLLVAFWPRVGGYVVMLWLLGIIINLLLIPEAKFLDIALRDFGLALGALALARLSEVHGRPVR